MMHVTAILIGLASLAAAKIVPVEVGEGGLVFKPASVTADVGDIVQFNFYRLNHSVAQSESFDKPCHPAAKGFFSGYVVDNSTTDPAKNMFFLMINDTNPIWYYCSQVNHCAPGGMVGVINPTANQTVESFVGNAKKDTEISPMGEAMGGNLTSVAPSNSSTNASSTTSGGAGGSTASSTSTASGSATSPPKNAGAAKVVGGAVGGGLALLAALAL